MAFPNPLGQQPQLGTLSSFRTGPGQPPGFITPQQGGLPPPLPNPSWQQPTPSWAPWATHPEPPPGPVPEIPPLGQPPRAPPPANPGPFSSSPTMPGIPLSHPALPAAAHASPTPLGPTISPLSSVDLNSNSTNMCADIVMQESIRGPGMLTSSNTYQQTSLTDYYCCVERELWFELLLDCLFSDEVRDFSVSAEEEEAELTTVLISLLPWRKENLPVSVD